MFVSDFQTCHWRNHNPILVACIIVDAFLSLLRSASLSLFSGNSDSVCITVLSLSHAWIRFFLDSSLAFTIYLSACELLIMWSCMCRIYLIQWFVPCNLFCACAFESSWCVSGVIVSRFSTALHFGFHSCDLHWIALLSIISLVSWSLFRITILHFWHLL